MTIVIFQSDASSQVPATSSDEPYELRFSSVPRDPTDIDNALNEVRLELKHVTTQPAASQPTTQAAEDPTAKLHSARMSLWDALGDLELQLRELLRLTRELDRTATQAATHRLTGQIAQWRARAEELAQTPLPANVEEREIEEITAEYAKAQQRLDTLSTAIAQQQDLSREGFRKDREKLKNDLSRASAAQVALEASFATDLKAAADETAKETLIDFRRAAHARVASNETARAVVDLREKTVQQDMERHVLERDGLQPYLDALIKRKDALVDLKSQNRTERLRRRLDNPNTSALTKLFLNLQLIHEETLSSLQKDYMDKIRGRFGPIALRSLEFDKKQDEIYLQQLEESLGRRSAADVLEAYEEAQQEENKAASDLRKKLTMLDRTFGEQREIESMKRERLAKYDKIEKEFRQLTRDSTDPEAIRMKQQVGQMRIELKNAFEDIPKVSEVRDSLKKAVEFANQRLELWQAARSKLYWSHLLTRGPSYFSAEVYEPVKKEFTALRANALPSALSETRESFVFQCSRLQPVDWAVIITAESIITALMVMLYRRSLYVVKKSRVAPERPESQGIAFMDRLKPRMAKAGAVLIPLLWPPALLATFVLASGLEPTPRTLALAMSAIWAATVMFPSLLYIAFHASKTRYRVVPCSSVVARHYVRTGYTALLLGLFTLAPAILLWSLQLVPETVDLLFEAFQFLITLAVFVFLLRKEAVLNLIPRTQRGRFAGTMTALQALYPVILLLLLTLVVLRFSGFAAMASYITIGLAGTIGVALLAWFVYLFLREMIVWMVQHTRTMREAYAPPAESPAAPEEAARKPEPLLPLPGKALVTDSAETGSRDSTAASSPLPGAARLSLSVIRWSLAGCWLFAALYAWQLRPYELKQLFDIRLWDHGGQEITLWRIGAAILTMALAVWTSRAVRQALRSRLYPSHPGLDIGAQAAIDTLLHYAIVLIGIYATLQTLRLDFGALAVLFGGLGLGLGLGLQPLIVNFVSGLIILFERQVKVGDVVNMADKQGEIVRISMRSTIVRTPDGLHIIVPNGDFINQKVENWTLGHQPVRGVLDIVVSYRTDPERVRGILIDVARRERLSLRYPPPDVSFKEMTDSGMSFSIAAWFRNMSERGAGLLNMRYAIADRFNVEGIEIPVKATGAITVGGDKKLSETK